jgi:hypothetical protein
LRSCRTRCGESAGGRDDGTEGDRDDWLTAAHLG